MRLVNIVKLGKVTNSNVVADDVHATYHDGEKYVPCLLYRTWQPVRASVLERVAH